MVKKEKMVLATQKRTLSFLILVAYAVLFHFPSTLVAQTVYTHTVLSVELQQEYAIQVRLPANYSASKAYPVVYVLDGDNLFGLASDICTLLESSDQITDLIVVSIGYGDKTGGSKNKRNRDFTPSKNASIKGSGGAADFSQCLETNIIPLIERTYSSASGQRTLVGWSLGGLYGLYALFFQTELFSNYILISPSLWWDNDLPMTYEARYSTVYQSLPAKVYMCVGRRETLMAVLQTEQLAREIKNRNYTGLDIKMDILADENHYTTPAAGFSRGIRWIFAR